MLRCGSFIGLSSATALRGRRGRFGGRVALSQAKITRSNRVGAPGVDFSKLDPRNGRPMVN
jgi:hypothetical protein